MPMWRESVNGIFATASKTASISVITRPPQSPEMRSTMAWPDPVDPLGLGAATTPPSAAAARRTEQLGRSRQGGFRKGHKPGIGTDRGNAAPLEDALRGTAAGRHH